MNQPHSGKKGIEADDLVATSPPEPPPYNEADNDLAYRLRDERRKRLRGQFIWVFLLVALFNFHVFVAIPIESWESFMHADSWFQFLRMHISVGVVTFVLFELIFLGLYAERCEYPLAAALIGRARSFLFGLFKGY